MIRGLVLRFVGQIALLVAAAVAGYWVTMLLLY
jgi:hypothetical protein